MRAPLSVLVILLAAAAPAALAQDDPRADLDIAFPALATPEGRAAPFGPGDTVEAVVRMENVSDLPLALRRIVIQSSPSLVLLDPTADGADNDGDGAVDGPAEALQRRGRDGSAWRMRSDGLAIAPGEAIERVLRFRVRGDALAGTAGYVSIATGTTVAEGARSQPRRSRRLHPVPFAPPVPTLAAMPEGEERVAAQQPVLTASVILPGGILPDARVSLRLSPAFGVEKVGAPVLGEAIDCAGEARVERGARGVDLILGRCRVDGEAPPEDRTLRFEIDTALTDADPAATEAGIAAWRELSGALRVLSGDALLAATTLGGRLTGPLLAVEALEGNGARHRPGDTVTARFRIRNRGDRALLDPALRLTNDAAFACRTIRVGTRPPADCADGIALDTALPPDAELTVEARATLRPDAVIGAETGIALALTGRGIDPVPFPVPPVEMMPHGYPSLEVARAGDWTREDGILTATIGQAGRLRLRGTLPPGRYRGDVRLLARVIDARTGAPVGPAAVTVTEARLTVVTVGGDVLVESTEAVAKADTLWAQRILPFDLTEDDTDGARGFTADIAVSLADAPVMARGRLVELTAESTAYGDSAVSGTSWIEVLVTEPDLRPKLFSPGEDRVIEPGEPLAVVALACNYGDAPAHRADLSLALPARLDAAAMETRAFTLPLDAVQTRVFEALAGEIEAMPGARIAPNDARDRLVLSPEDGTIAPLSCLGMEMSAPLAPDRSGRSATVGTQARIGPYAGVPEGREGRGYPGASTAVSRFRVPAMRFGPSATIRLGETRRLSHAVELETPDWLGPFRLSLSPESSTGLDWALFGRGADGTLAPWTDGVAFEDGETVALEMRAEVPEALPLGWVDTSSLRATIETEDGRIFAVALRLVSRGEAGAGDAIETSRRVARDRDCDGELADETAQDAVFEAGKDAAPGECLTVRIEFENAGEGEIERIVIRDRLPPRTVLLEGSPAVRIAPEPIDRTIPPDPAGDGRTLEWVFEGLFRPGAIGEVEYGLRLPEPDPTERPE